MKIPAQDGEETPKSERIESAEEEAEPQEVTPVEDEAHSPYRLILLAAVKALLIGVLIQIIKYPIENSPLFDGSRTAAYNFLQHQLFLSENRVPDPVVVVDISDLPRDERNPFAPDAPVTNRALLLDTLQRAVALHPRVVAVDIDFAPDAASGGYVGLNDPEFFTSCLRLRSEAGVPIYLGIERTAARPAAEWLGAPEFAPLATSLLLPIQNSRVQLRWTQVAGSKSERRATMAATVASVWRGETGAVAPFLRPFLRARQDAGDGTLVDAETFLVDYGPLERLRADLIPWRDLQAGRVSPEALRGRAVLLGDVDAPQAADRFTVPDRSGTFPGVLLHACGARTLIEAPLYELTLLGQTALDFGLGFLALSSVTIYALYRTWRTGEAPGHESRETRIAELLFAIGVAVTAFVIGVLFVNRTRVMWDDFPLVIAGLFLDQPLTKLGSFLAGLFRRGKGDHDADSDVAPEEH